ncbi:MAG TPA: hypothetical protein VER58_02630 [Thermoanaerobaculia bacterium]|nr:hypothetical protein [Thermoanaerobaculia bacterium]
MFELKPLSKEAIPKALERADRYRLLNEPGEAESICMDVLAAEPENQRALVTLILALTDQFGQQRFNVGDNRCDEFIARLHDKYERVYYAGVVCERRAKAAYSHHQGGTMAYEWFRDAMGFYEEAEKLRPAGNDDAVLRWNTCARILQSNRDLQPAEEQGIEPYLE